MNLPHPPFPRLRRCAAIVSLALALGACAIGPTYEIYRGGRQAAVVKKKLFTLFRNRFSIDVPGPDDLEAVGDFINKDYAFHRGGREVARVSKKWFRMSDTYGIDVAAGEDDVLILASAVVIDLCVHPDNKND